MQKTTQITDFKQWLSEECDKKHIAYLDEEKTLAYIPIGFVEETLDNFYYWETKDFKFSIYHTSSYWFASGSIALVVEFKQDSEIVKLTRHGAVTIPISSSDINMDYEATVLSMCIANAAKKLGKKFGRHLNGRLEIGENSFTYKNVEKVEETPEEKRWKKLIAESSDAEELVKYKKGLPKNLTSLYVAKLKTLTK